MVTTPQPTVLDLCCGYCGWSRAFAAEGWLTISVDWTAFHHHAPHRFILADVNTFYPNFTFDAVVASPPCQEYSRHGMPWTRARNPTQPDLTLWRACERIAHNAQVPIVIENVRSAQYWHGRSVINYGPFHLWGNAPCLLPPGWPRTKESLSGTQAQERAEIPANLGRWVARCMKRER